MRMLKLSKKVKIELASAIAMVIVLSSLTIMYSSKPQPDYGFNGYRTLDPGKLNALEGMPAIQQIINENIQGELRSGSFETVIRSLRNLTSYYDGRMPYLSMQYENDLWHGNANCKIPTENVTDFTIDVRQLISDSGKVTHISITVTEEETNQTSQAEAPMSTVTIALYEVAEGGSAIPSQIGAAISWLVTPLLWVAEGLVIIVPLSFVCLGIVMLFDRGIIPVWKRQFKNRNLSKPSIQ
jgi:hypothetical protein